MTEQELKDIVAAVVAELEKSGVDFDYKAEQAKDDDLVFVIRGTAPNYQGVTVTWKGLLDIITAQATQAKNDAVTAKNTANTILTQVQSKGTEITNFVATSKTEIETQKNESVNAVKSVYQTDLDELKGDIDTERNARIEADTEHSARLQNVELASSVNRYEIDNLKAKAEGKLYRTETVEAEAYTVDVPSSVAPYAELQRIKGKSVVWNQIHNVPYSSYTPYRANLVSTTDTSITIKGSKSENYMQIYKDNAFTPVKGHKYFCKCKYESTLENPNIYVNLCNAVSNIAINENNMMYDMITLDGSFSSNNRVALYCDQSTEIIIETTFSNIQIFDITLMFGAGNEPTLEECKKIFSADYYPYDAGTIKSFPVKRVKSLKADGTEIGNIDVSSFTTDFKSAGSAHDEWSDGKVTKRIGAVDLGTLGWGYYKGLFFSDISDKRKIIMSHNGSKSNLLCAKYTSTIIHSSMSCENRQMYEYYNSSIDYSLRIVIRDDAYTDISSFKSAMSGVMLYYELATPTEETVPEIDNYIQVDGGGTLTFESDDAVHMPVPSTDRFVVDLTSTTEETI